jgi:uncharacterized membrane protein YfbV (UPF0208 family)
LTEQSAEESIGQAGPDHLWGKNEASRIHFTDVTMIQAIGFMVGFYILTRMTQLVFSESKDLIAIVASITFFATLVCMGVLWINSRGFVVTLSNL